MQSLDLNLYLTIHDHGSLHGIPYRWGAKPDPKLSTNKIAGSDCSGWWHYLMSRCGYTGIPSGQAFPNQCDWLRAQGCEVFTSYQAGLAAKKTPLAVCFIKPVAGGHAGHVFSVTVDDMQTQECYGGVGVGSRSCLTPVLIREFHAGLWVPCKT